MVKTNKKYPLHSKCKRCTTNVWLQRDRGNLIPSWCRASTRSLSFGNNKNIEIRFAFFFWTSFTMAGSPQSRNSDLCWHSESTAKLQVQIQVDFTTIKLKNKKKKVPTFVLLRNEERVNTRDQRRLNYIQSLGHDSSATNPNKYIIYMLFLRML